MSFAPASLPWFASHELRLQWRDLTGMLTGGKRRRAVGVVLFGLFAAVVMHLLAQILVKSWVEAGISRDATTFAQVTGFGLLFATMSLSQAMESVTRAYYARADLDLILSSPASPKRIFAVRTLAIAITSTLLSAMVILPFIDLLVVLDGPHWAMAYFAIAAVSMCTTALAVLIVLGLFRLLGARRTRIVSQILAALVGASLVVGIQVAVIVTTGSTTNIGRVVSSAVLGLAPSQDSILWWPARAAMGEFGPLLVFLGLSMAVLGCAIWLSARSFAVIASAALASTAIRSAQKSRPFRSGTPAQMLRRKERTLLLRDPWLLSQTLMQLVYLVPPAILLWLNFGSGGSAMPIVMAIVVMASGQLSGGIAWLTLSGEDAHDLVASAPITRRQLYLAKIEAVLGVIAAVTAPLILGVALTDLRQGAILVVGVACASGSAIVLQLMFRVRGRRAQFARRQTASRIATILEALVSITWAGAIGLAAVMPLVGAIAALPAIVVLVLVVLFRRNATPV